MKHKIKTTILLTTLAVTILHIINRCIISAATIKNLLLKDIGKFFNWRFGRIFYTKTGSGPPILLIHDLIPYASSYEWNEIIKKLSKDHTVYAIDLLGCGRSDKTNMTYTNFLYVQLITDFVKQVIGQKTDVMATGLSSSFVIMACRNDSELFHKIIMVNPENLTKLNNIPGKRSKVIKFLMDLPIIGTAVYHMIVNKNSLEYLFTEKYLYNPFHMQQKWLHIYYESAHLNESRGKYLLSSITGFYINANINSALKEINNSMVIIAGKKCDNIESIVDNYTAINPAIEVDYIDKVKMIPQLESPDEFYRHLEIFL